MSAEIIVAFHVYGDVILKMIVGTTVMRVLIAQKENADVVSCLSNAQ